MLSTEKTVPFFLKLGRTGYYTAGAVLYSSSAWVALKLDAEKSFDIRIFVGVYALILLGMFTADYIYTCFIKGSG